MNGNQLLSKRANNKYNDTCIYTVKDDSFFSLL